VYLVYSVWCSALFSKGGMNRELGANPKQTRCCEFQSNNFCNTFATVPNVGNGKAQKLETSQKTCRTLLFNHAFEE